MSAQSLRQDMADAIWVAHSLFERGKVTGSTANLSFAYEKRLYVTGSGSSFGNLKEADFSVISFEGKHLSGPLPSKEFPLHLALIGSNEAFGAVLHTHSFYATLWSCFVRNRSDLGLPHYTPYLKMKLGEVQMIPYAPPGTEQLFASFREHLDGRAGYLLCNHGPVVAAQNILQAFYALEELEESCHLAWELRNEQVAEI